MKTVVVTRHKALVEYLTHKGLIPEGAKIIPHATAEEVRGCRVVGVLPLHLAAEAACVVEVPLALPPELRGRELALEEVEKHAGEATTFVVFKPAHPEPPGARRETVRMNLTTKCLEVLEFEGGETSYPLERMSVVVLK